MKRLLMIIAIAVAASFAAPAVETAYAIDAHHHAKATKIKKAKAPAKTAKSSQMHMMQCRMMDGSMHGMRRGRMMGGMTCPMMGDPRGHRMMHGMHMGPGAMRHGQMSHGNR